MISNDFLARALQERRGLQQRNQLEEARRREEVARKVPAIGRLMQERQAAIMRGLRQASEGVHPGPIEQETLERNATIVRLLAENGFPESYLSPIYGCALCHDSGYTGDDLKTICSCVTERYHRLLSGETMGDGRHTFENYDDSVYPAAPMEGEEVSQRAYTRLLREQCERYADSLPHSEVQNLLLYGGSGLGKTFLLKSIGVRAAGRGVSVLSLTANELLNQIRKHYFSREEEPAPWQHAQLLLIDDLGTEPMWENITIEQLFALIDLRLTGGRHTVISTNLGLTELQRRYTERITSRLLDTRLCRRLRFMGQDVRLLRR